MLPKNTLQKKSLIQKYFAADIVILDAKFNPKSMLNKVQLVHLAEILLKSPEMPQKNLFKAFYLLFQLCILAQELQESAILQLLKNIIKEHDFKELVISMFGHAMNSPERILIGRIAAFLNHIKIEKINQISLINSLINQYHEYRLLDLFKQISAESLIICSKISAYINKYLLIQAHNIKQIQWQRLSPSQFQHFYQKMNELRVINIRINHLKSQYLQIQSIELFDQKTMVKMEEKYNKLKNICKSSENKQNSINLQQNYVKRQENAQEKSVIRVKKNLKAMGLILKKMKTNVQSS